MNWSNVFNASLSVWINIGYAFRAANEAGYPYTAWNGRIYNSQTGVDTGQLVENLGL